MVQLHDVLDTYIEKFIQEHLKIEYKGDRCWQIMYGVEGDCDAIFLVGDYLATQPPMIEIKKAVCDWMVRNYEMEIRSKEDEVATERLSDNHV